MEHTVVKRKLVLWFGTIVVLCIAIVCIVINKDDKGEKEDSRMIIWEGNFVGTLTTYPDSSRYEKTTVELKINDDKERLIDVTVRTSSGASKGNGGGTVMTLVDNGVSLQIDETQEISFSMKPSRLELPNFGDVEIKDVFVELEYVNFNKIRFKYANSEEELSKKTFIELKRQETGVKTNSANIIGGKKETVSECDAQSLAKSIVNLEKSIDVYEKLNDETFIKEVSDVMALTREDPNAYFDGNGGFYISKCQVCSFNLMENSLVNTVRLYLFDVEKTPIGEIMIYKHNDKLGYEIVVYGEYTNSDILKILKTESDKEYIILYNGEKNILLNEENKPSGSGLKIIGDVFEILNEDVLTVTYNQLVEDMIWIEVE